MVYTDKIQKAINIAIKYHSGQYRKGKDIPYIVHPFGVGLILARVTDDEDIICAGLLHDTLEDTELSPDELKKLFGENIFTMVNDVTEQDKSLSWGERKRLALEHVSKMGHGSLLVKSADVLNNLSDQINDYKTLGDEMFARFNAGKEVQLKRYTNLIDEIEKFWRENPLLPDLKARLQEVQKLWS